MPAQDYFATRIYREDLTDTFKLNHELESVAMDLSEVDRAGIKWCEAHSYPGYTSFASIDDLHRQSKEFGRLEKIIQRHAKAFAKDLDWELRGLKPVCDTLWVNVMPEGGSHTSHIHRNAVISGTYYVATPEGAGPIVFEDPRIGLMMAAPPGHPTQVSQTPKSGTLLLWESWLRHEVPLNRAAGNRISVSFNYCLG